jgi:hypothetical protein
VADPHRRVLGNGLGRRELADRPEPVDRVVLLTSQSHISERGDPAVPPDHHQDSELRSGIAEVPQDLWAHHLGPEDRHIRRELLDQSPSIAGLAGGDEPDGVAELAQPHHGADRHRAL